MDIGMAIKILRMKAGLTQEQLGERIGMSINSVSSLETGKTYPPTPTVKRLCEAFGIPRSYLMLASIDEGDFPEDKRVLYRALLEPLRKELLDEKNS